MKTNILITTLGIAAALPASAAVTFNWDDFPTTGFADNSTSINATLNDGSTPVTATATSSGGVLETHTGTANFNSHLGVVDSSSGYNSNSTDFHNNSNGHQASRISTTQSVSLSFDKDVIFNSLTTNNWLNGETLLITTNDLALTGLTGYDVIDGTGQSGDLTSFGYASNTFTMVNNNTNGSSTFTYLFGGDEGDNILLEAGDTLTFATGGPDSPGWGMGAFNVTVVPEPSSTALIGLGGLALILRRRK